MTNTVIKLVVIVGLTHGLRWLSRKAGPRWGGLIAGLPSTTAVVLFFLAAEHGREYAAKVAESGVIGLVAGAAMAAAFCWSAARGFATSTVFAVAGLAFIGIATCTSMLKSVDVSLPLLLLVSVSCLLAAFSQSVAYCTPSTNSLSSKSAWVGTALRTIVPATCVLLVTSFSQSLGTVAAGLLGTFPCMLTSLLIVTSLEEDVKSAGKLAQSFPLGQLATLSFVIVFGQLCHSVGVLPALVVGYATALATLVAIEGISQTLCRPDFFAHPNRDDRVVPLGTSGESF